MWKIEMGKFFIFIILTVLIQLTLLNAFEKKTNTKIICSFISIEITISWKDYSSERRESEQNVSTTINKSSTSQA